eukprot:Skav225061  [mRNA]  locus=scaffold2293:20241:21200:- [translate_table: standard]
MDQLRIKAVSQPTLDKYNMCIHLFEQWAREHRKSTSLNNLDRSVSEYLLQGYSSGWHIWHGSYLIYGLQLLRNRGPDKDFLVNAKKSLKAWRRRVPATARVPVPEEVILALGQIFLEQGHLQAAVALALQYDTYMRPSEVLSLTFSQVLPPGPRCSERYQKWGILLAPQTVGKPTKTMELDVSILVGDISRPWLHTMLRSYSTRTSPSSKMFPDLDLSRYERIFSAAMKELDIPLTVTPHVVRHSAASCDRFHKRRTLQQIQKRGRWATTKSVARYEKEALILHGWNQLSRTQQELVVQKSELFPKRLLRELKQPANPV